MDYPATATARNLVSFVAYHEGRTQHVAEAAHVAAKTP